MKHVVRIMNTCVAKNKALKEAGEFVEKMNHILLDSDAAVKSFIKHVSQKIEKINEAHARCGNIDMWEWDPSTWKYDSVNTTAYSVGTVVDFEILHIREVEWIDVKGE